MSNKKYHFAIIKVNNADPTKSKELMAVYIAAKDNESTVQVHERALTLLKSTMSKEEYDNLIKDHSIQIKTTLLKEDNNDAE